VIREIATVNTSRKLVDFAIRTTYGDIPQAAVKAAETAIADSIGTTVAGLGQDSTEVIMKHVTQDGGEGCSTIIGTGKKSKPAFAALANAASAHSLDYDSISLVVSGFVSTAVFFAVLALAEEITETTGKPVSGKELLEAFIVGWEVEAAIARGVNVHHYQKGWHPTATLGHFGAAVGAAKLLGLDANAMHNAIGVTTSESSGIKIMIGNMLNPYHIGKASRNGVNAAKLAQNGFLAHPEPFEHMYGFCNLFNGAGNYSLEAMEKNIGQPYDLEEPGLVVKYYPCCGLIHSAGDAVIDLVEETGLKPEDVEKIRVGTHYLVPRVMQVDVPKTGYEAKFSIGYCVACAFVTGKLDLQSFDDAVVSDPVVLDLMKRVEHYIHPELMSDDMFLLKEFSEVEVTTKDQKVFTKRVDRIYNKGSDKRPLTASEFKSKYMSCIGTHPRTASFERALDMVLDLENLKDIRQLTELIK
jgi:2-methylcitrate dehydratase PrpD